MTCGVNKNGVVVVTGALGLIGSHIARALAQDGRRIAICDTHSPLQRPYLGGIDWDAWLTPAQLVPWLEDHACKVSAVIHMGAISDTTESSSERLKHSNVDPSLALWHLAARHGWAYLYASSAATYGDGSHGFCDHDDPAFLARLQPLNLYGWSKHSVDRQIMDEVRAGRPAPPVWAGFKFFNVFGPGEAHKGPMQSLVAKIVPRILNGQPVELFCSHREDIADGEQARDFIYVKDAIQPVLRALQRERLGGLFNVGTGVARSFRDLALATCSALGRDPLITYHDTPKEIRQHYQYLTQASCAKSQLAGLYAFDWPLEKAVGDYVAHLLQCEEGQTHAAD